MKNKSASISTVAERYNVVAPRLICGDSEIEKNDV